MRPRAVVVVDKLSEDATHVPFVDHDEVVEALAPEGADHALGDRIRLG